MRPRMIPLLACAVVLLGSMQTDPLVLTPIDIGEAYYDRAPEDIERRTEWVGLYIGDDGSRLERANVRFDAEPDGRDTVYSIVTEPERAELLVSGVPAVTAGPAVTLIRWTTGLSYDEPTMELHLGDTAYTLHLIATDPMLCDAVIELTDGARTQRLYEAGQGPYSCDEPHFDIHWAGDLDRDGRLDLAVTFSSKYSHHPRQLLLSGSAGPDALVEEAARRG